MTGEVSHGRGGAGNINPDDTKYVDGEIVRQGDAGSHNDGAYSTGRGGVGNIGDSAAARTDRLDKDHIPEEATRPSADVDHHVGRGGAANIQLTAEHQKKKVADSAFHSGTEPNVSVADKIKAKLFGLGKK